LNYGWFILPFAIMPLMLSQKKEEEEDGDINSRFFHSYAFARKKTNNIVSLVMTV